VKYKEEVPKRTKQVNVRLTERERKILSRIAEDRGIDDSAVLRMTLLDYYLRYPAKPQPKDKEIN